MSPIAVVTGQRGVGKTALIQRFLESNRSRVVCASRCQAVPGSGNWKEETLPVLRAYEIRIPRADELRKYEEAGADLVSVISYDSDRMDVYSVLHHAAGAGGCDEWIVEADIPGYLRSDCSVFVGRPLAPGVPVTREETRVVARVDLSDVLGVAIDGVLEHDPRESMTNRDGESGNPEKEWACPRPRQTHRSPRNPADSRQVRSSPLAALTVWPLRGCLRNSTDQAPGE